LQGALVGKIEGRIREKAAHVAEQIERDDLTLLAPFRSPSRQGPAGDLLGELS